MQSSATHITVTGDLSGEYVVDEQLDDGRLVIRPDTTVAAMRARLGGEPVVGDEFHGLVDQYGIAGPDGEG